MADSLAHSAARGALFTLGAQLARILLQLLSVVVLARLLTPYDYGLLAIALVVIGVGEIFRDFGLTSASVQAPHLSHGQRDNLFWINTALGVVLAAIVFGLSWPLAAMTQQPELRGMMQVLSVVFVMNGLATQYRAQLMRELRFRAMAVADILSALVALAVAVATALLGAGYWALAAQQLTAAFVLLAVLVGSGRWLPRLFSRRHPTAGLVRFGSHLVATNLLTYASSQIDTVLVAAKFGAAPLGLYNRAYQLVMTPLAQVRSPITNVALPVFSRVQKDHKRFDGFVTGGQLALGYTFGIPLLLVCGMAEPVVGLMLGPQWEGAVPILRFFAIAGTLTTLSFVGYWVYVSRGLSRELFRYTLVSTAIKVVCIVGGSFFGLVGIAAGFALAPAIAWPVSIFWLSRLTPLPVAALYSGAVRVLVVASAAGAASWGAAAAVVPHGDLVQLGVGLAAGLAVVGLALLTPPIRRDARTLTSFVRLMVKRERRILQDEEGDE
ncbi:lipopolysaccharide biosynthesis protein [Microbacterium koreense]|uniref:Lipopolysaccharide biosynthesis protein n=1 Tax=Microbacterium koreense TaxID=323761 RepID=A0ABW2ZP03_9MICO